VVNDTQSALPWERDPVSTVQEAGWASRPVWMGAENHVNCGCCKSVCWLMVILVICYMVFEYSDCRMEKRQDEKTSSMKILPQMLLPLISKEILDLCTFQYVSNKQVTLLIHFVPKNENQLPKNQVK